MTQDEADPWLAPLFRRLVAQTTAFGLFTPPHEAAKVMDAFVLPRLGFLATFAEALRDTPFMRRAIAGLPFIYNTAQWPEGAPVAGFMEPDSVIPPADFLASLSAIWHLQCMDEDSAGGAEWKLVRAAAWILEREGFLPALSYVLELQRSGCVLRDETTAGALCILLDARRGVASDEEIAGLLFETPHCSAKEWPRRVFRELQVDATRFLRPDLSDDFDRLIDEAEARVERMLETTNFDDWMLGQACVWKELTTLRRVFEHHEQWEALAYVGRTTRLEEIRADAGAHFRVARSRLGSRVYTWDNTMLSAMTMMVRGSTEDWLERFLEDRALLPRELEPLALVGGDLVTLEPSALPARWQAFSATLAPAWAACVLDDAMMAFRRRRPFRLEDDHADSLAEPFLESKDIGAARVREALLALVCDRPGVDEAPLRELAQAAIGAQQDLDDFVAELHREMVIEEIRSLMRGAMQKGDPSAAEATRARWCELYPYFAGAALERAIGWDEAGRHEESLAEIERSIVLSPRDAPPWHSLGVILLNLGRRQEAAFAQAISASLGSDPPNG